MKRLLITMLLSCCSAVAQESPFLTYDNFPMGSKEEPLILRTFMPKADLSDEVLSNHHLGMNSPKYNPKLGKDVKGEYKPITGLPAAIGINHGSQLSYCWDTVECRLLYTWNDGFLNMKKYWGDPKRGNRQSYGYVPELVGNLFYLAAGKHPIVVDGMSVKSPRYLGFSKEKDRFVFKFKTAKGKEIHTTISPSGKPNSFRQRIQLKGDGALSYAPGNPETTEVKKVSNQELVVTVSQATIKPYVLKVEKALTAEDVTAANGEIIFNKMACATCHSTDGAKSHGPTLMGIAGSQRPIIGMKDKVLGDDAYLKESILDPNKKVLHGFPPNYMPAFKLPKNELDSLLLYIKTLKN